MVKVKFSKKMLLNILLLTSLGSLQTHAMSNIALLCASQPETQVHL